MQFGTKIYLSTSFRIKGRNGTVFTGRLKMSPLTMRRTTPARREIILTRIMSGSMCLSSLKVSINLLHAYFPKCNIFRD